MFTFTAGDLSATVFIYHGDKLVGKAWQLGSYHPNNRERWGKFTYAFDALDFFRRQELQFEYEGRRVKYFDTMEELQAWLNNNYQFS